MCALFVPVISAATQARLEGYFRIEWKLAARRTHAMATAKAFLLPVVIDDTRDAGAHVPEEFFSVQWTRLRQGYGGQAREDASVAVFCARVATLIDGGKELETGRLRPVRDEVVAAPNRTAPASRNRSWAIGLAALGALAAVAVAVWSQWKRAASVPAAATAAMSEASRLVAKAGAHPQ